MDIQKKSVSFLQVPGKKGGRGLYRRVIRNLQDQIAVCRTDRAINTYRKHLCVWPNVESTPVPPIQQRLLHDLQREISIAASSCRPILRSSKRIQINLRTPQGMNGKIFVRFWRTVGYS
ncbi:hypothetical protein JTE90_003969 [Oedothorax gibbosus]|uniref:Uncharacterized protein n=1 Tax=Oedothorax gibbosus TaxID=931172 RepID=A0AAV6UYL4_9ARAC|nr:hypothetical protein JTE90_003969 [Oedothorax gibbosus]